MCYEADSIVAGVTAVVVQTMPTSSEGDASFSLPSCFADSDDMELDPGQFVLEFDGRIIGGECSCVIGSYLQTPMAACPEYTQ